MKVVIIEDEKPAARRLSRMLNDLNIQPIAMLHSIEESLNWLLQNEQPDLLFLDIQLSDGLSFEIFDEIEVKSAIIFTTAYDEYALKAFKLNSVDYLLKPIDTDELKNAIDKYQEIYANKNLNTISNQQLKEIIFPNRNTYKKRFTVKIGQHIKLISTASIECFYSKNKATYFCTNNNRNYMIDDTLEVLETKLSPEIFFRVSRKCFVNVNAIKDIVSYTNSRLKIILNNYCESEIIVSRERVKDFKNWIG
jgi:DNA-binding LytR/AlgR family response regulator